MKIQRIYTKNEDETAHTAKIFAATLKAGDVILLSGPLGAGKSVFARALIRALCRDEKTEVPSPTFTLLQVYEGAEFNIYHYDLYRITDFSEIYELGWNENIHDGVAIVEWPERLGPLSPKRRIEISITPAGDQNESRDIEITRIAYDAG